MATAARRDGRGVRLDRLPVLLVYVLFLAGSPVGHAGFLGLHLATEHRVVPVTATPHVHAIQAHAGAVEPMLPVGSPRAHALPPDDAEVHRLRAASDPTHTHAADEPAPHTHVLEGYAAHAHATEERSQAEHGHEHDARPHAGQSSPLATQRHTHPSATGRDSHPHVERLVQAASEPDPPGEVRHRAGSDHTGGPDRQVALDRSGTTRGPVATNLPHPHNGQVHTHDQNPAEDLATLTVSLSKYHLAPPATSVSVPVRSPAPPSVSLAAPLHMAHPVETPPPRRLA